MSLYDDEKRVAEVTRTINACGIRCLQAHRLMPDERDHAHVLLDFFDPPTGVTVLDLGAGTGALADYMIEERPDLSFILLNRSQVQLDMASDRHRKVCGDFEHIPALPGHPTAAMMTYALGHGLLHMVMREVARVLPTGALFLLYDLTAAKFAKELFDKLDYHAYSVGDIVTAAEKEGLMLDAMIHPDTTHIGHMLLIMSVEEFSVFRDVHPALFRFVKT